MWTGCPHSPHGEAKTGVDGPSTVAPLLAAIPRRWRPRHPLPAAFIDAAGFAASAGATSAQSSTENYRGFTFVLVHLVGAASRLGVARAVAPRRAGPFRSASPISETMT